jgi:two-component system chemotaxis sensor kinase CheA
MSDSDIVKDFLQESYENLDRLDRELVGLEKNPRDTDALASVFRTIHTIKGTCGFLGFDKLEKVAHVGENLLTRLRDAQLLLNPEITTGLLSMVDAVREMLKEIESTGKDGGNPYPELLQILAGLQETAASVAVAPPGTVAEKSSPLEKKNDQRNARPEKSVAPPQSADPQTTFGSSRLLPAPESKMTAADTIRVGVNLLDKLMTLVGELVLARNQLLQVSNTSRDTGLQTVSQRMNLIATELQEEVMKTRMQPIGNIWNQFPRTVRDVATRSHGWKSCPFRRWKRRELDGSRNTAARFCR